MNKFLPQEKLSQIERQARYEVILEQVVETVEDVKKQTEPIAGMSIRVTHLEKVVYGLCALVAAQMISGIAALLIWLAQKH